MLFFLLIVYVVPRVSFFSCNSEIMYSYLLDILFLIVLSFSFGGQFLYGNPVSPCLLLSFSYCTFIYIYNIFFVRISRMHVATLHDVAHFAARTTQVWKRGAHTGNWTSEAGLGAQGSAVVCAVKLECGANWWVTFVCPLYWMRYYNCTALFAYCCSAK